MSSDKYFWAGQKLNKCTLCEENFNSRIRLEQHEVNVHGYLHEEGNDTMYTGWNLSI